MAGGPGPFPGQAGAPIGMDIGRTGEAHPRLPPRSFHGYLALVLSLRVLHHGNLSVAINHDSSPKMRRPAWAPFLGVRCQTQQRHSWLRSLIPPAQPPKRRGPGGSCEGKRRASKALLPLSPRVDSTCTRWCRALPWCCVTVPSRRACLATGLSFCHMP